MPLGWRSWRLKTHQIVDDRIGGIRRFGATHVIVSDAAWRADFEVLQVAAAVVDDAGPEGDDAEAEGAPEGVKMNDLVAKLIGRTFCPNFFDHISGSGVEQKRRPVSDKGQNFGGSESQVLKLLEIF